jgi:hypothetical protein
VWERSFTQGTSCGTGGMTSSGCWQNLDHPMRVKPWNAPGAGVIVELRVFGAASYERSVGRQKGTVAELFG